MEKEIINNNIFVKYVKRNFKIKHTKKIKLKRF